MNSFSIPAYLQERFQIELHQQQKEALDTIEGPVLLLAVPGAGKTTVTVARIANMIVNGGIAPGNILTITFSKAAALDMQHRYRMLFGDLGCEIPHFSTIHSLCFRILKSYCKLSGGEPPVLLEGQGSTKSRSAILREIYSSVNGEFLSEDTEEELVSCLGLIKNSMMKQEDAALIDTDIQKLWMLYERYSAYKRENGLMDFDDMLSYACTALRKYPELLKQYRQRYPYLCVDEAQDTSKLQHEIIRLLAAPKNNLFMVGDEDQSIYGFRGAQPQNLMHFSEIYPNARILKMEENFRSTKSIVERAAVFISQNQNRYEKKMVTRAEQGEPISTPKLRDLNEQYQMVVETCVSSCGSVAVIYRNNFSAIPLLDILERNDVDFFIRDHKTSFRNHYVIGDILAFCDLSFDRTNLKAFTRIFHKTSAYIRRNLLQTMNTAPLLAGETWFDRILEHSRDQSNTGRARYVAAMIESLKTMTPAKAIDTILGPIGYLDFLEYTCGTSFSNQAHKLMALKNLALRVRSLEELLERIDEIDEIIAVHSERKDSHLTLTTAHSAKGLEFDTVILLDAVEDIFPNHTAIEQEKVGKGELMEEEARLFYVAVTRARKKLIIPHSDYSGDTRIFPSRFLPRLMNDPFAVGENGEFLLYAGMHVEHSAFGKGQVMSINRDQRSFVAFFGQNGTRTLTMDILGTDKIKPVRT